MDEVVALSLLSKFWVERVAPETAPNACILGARLAREVLDYFAIRHDLVTVHVNAINDVMYDWAANGTSDQPPDDGWAVLVGRDVDAQGGGWNGHIVVTTDDWLLDLAAVQFHRPLKGIVCPGPLMIQREDVDIFKGRSVQMAHYQLERGHYLWAPEDNSGYKQGPDWQRNYKPYAGAAIRALKSLVA